MNRQFPAARFSRAARSLGIAALCLALSAPLSAQEPRPRATLEGHVEAVESVSFSPDGKTLASASLRCSIKLWDVASGRNIATLKEERPGAKELPYLWARAAFSPPNPPPMMTTSGTRADIIPLHSPESISLSYGAGTAV